MGVSAKIPSGIMASMKREDGQAKKKFELTFDENGKPIWPTRPEMTPARLTAIKFLDELRTGSDEDMPDVPLACIVQVKDYREIPLAKELYALVTVTTGEKGSSWKLAVYRGTAKPRAKMLFVSADAALPIEPRFRNMDVATYREKKFKLGDGVIVTRLRPHVKRHIYRLNSGLLYPLKDFPELKGFKVGTDATAALNIRSESTLKTLVEVFARRKFLASGHRGTDNR